MYLLNGYRNKAQYPAAIIDGKMDDYPENAFFNVGTIDDVKRAAEKMQASVK